MNGGKKPDDDATKALPAVAIDGDSGSRRERPTVEYNAEAIAEAAQTNGANQTLGALPPRPHRPSGVRSPGDTMTEGPSAREEVAISGLPELPLDNVDIAAMEPVAVRRELPPAEVVPLQEKRVEAKAEEKTVQRPSVSGKATQRSPQLGRPSVSVRDDKLPTQITKLPISEVAPLRPERQTIAELPNVARGRNSWNLQIALALAMVLIVGVGSWFAFGRTKPLRTPVKPAANEEAKIAKLDEKLEVPPAPLTEVAAEKQQAALELAAAPTPLQPQLQDAAATKPKLEKVEENPAVAAPAASAERNTAKIATKPTRASLAVARWTHEVFGTAGDPAAPYLALRAEPSPLADMIAQMPDATHVEVLGEKGRWRQVRIRSGKDTNIKGFCNVRWLRPRK